jgi:hypothetical protein
MSWRDCAHYRCWLWGLSTIVLPFVLLLPLAHLTPATAAVGDPPAGSSVARVEEDWQLVLNEPVESLNAPQFHTLMSPQGSTDGVYGQVSWNYWELPEFTAGGLQLQAWRGEDDLSHRCVRSDSLSRDAETVTWTQALQLHEHSVRFSLLNGHSSSWSTFGGPETYVDLPAMLTNLNGYSPLVSRSSSWITYGANRVDALKITAVRRYDVNGTLLSSDTTPLVVYQAPRE